MQISMSVKRRMIHVLMRVLIVLILWGTTAVSVIQDSLEMVTTVQVKLIDYELECQRRY